MQYAKGIHMQNHILQTAKTLMYEYGYKHTTYPMIAEKANVPVGLVNYYYKKQDLLIEIYRQFLDDIHLVIEEQGGGQLLNELQRHLLMSRIMFTRFFKDKQTLAYHLEINQGDLLPLCIHNSIRTSQIAMIKEYKSDYTQEYYYWCTTAEHGSIRELIELNKGIDITGSEFQKLLDLFGTIAVKLVGIDNEIIEKELEAVKETFQKLEIDQIHLLI